MMSESTTLREDSSRQDDEGLSRQQTGHTSEIKNPKRPKTR